MITADFAILPVGTKDTECKEYVTAAVQAIKDSGLNYQLTGMGTQIEAENLKEVFKTGIGRVYTVIKVDDRRDLENRTLDAKVDTVNKMLK